jgi:Flp pilus assembly protein TadD
VLLGALLVAMSLVPAPARGFRYVEVGHPVPVLRLDAGGGVAVTVPAPGRVTLLLFWRPGQSLSDEAFADVAALASQPSLAGVDVVGVPEAGSVGGPPASSSRLRLLRDPDGRVAQAYGIIVTPSAGIIDGEGRLAYYLPSRPANYRALLGAHVAHARREMNDDQLATRVAGLGESYGRAAEAVQAAYRRGVTLAREGRHADAVSALTEALRLAPDHLDARVQLGYAYLDGGQPAAALEQFERVLARNHGAPAARVGKGIARLRLGDADEAIRLLEEATALNPEPVRGHRELATAYEARGDLPRALEHYRWAYRKLLQGRK